MHKRQAQRYKDLQDHGHCDADKNQGPQHQKTGLEGGGVREEGGRRGEGVSCLMIGEAGWITGSVMKTSTRPPKTRRPVWRGRGVEGGGREGGQIISGGGEGVELQCKQLHKH